MNNEGAKERAPGLWPAPVNCEVNESVRSCCSAYVCLLSPAGVCCSHSHASSAVNVEACPNARTWGFTRSQCTKLECLRAHTFTNDVFMTGSPLGICPHRNHKRRQDSRKPMCAARWAHASKATFCVALATTLRRIRGDDTHLASGVPAGLVMGRCKALGVCRVMPTVTDPQHARGTVAAKHAGCSGDAWPCGKRPGSQARIGHKGADISSRTFSGVAQTLSKTFASPSGATFF